MLALLVVLVLACAIHANRDVVRVNMHTARGQVAFHCLIARRGMQWTPLQTLDGNLPGKFVHPDLAWPCYRVSGSGPNRALSVKWVEDADAVGLLRRFTGSHAAAGGWSIVWFTADQLAGEHRVLRRDDVSIPDAFGVEGTAVSPEFVRALGFEDALAIDCGPGAR